MLALVEPFDGIEPGSFREIPFQAIGPTVIFAAQNAGCTTFLLYDGICTMPAEIVEAINRATSVTDEEEGIIGLCEGDKLARFV